MNNVFKFSLSSIHFYCSERYTPNKHNYKKGDVKCIEDICYIVINLLFNNLQSKHKFIYSTKINVDTFLFDWMSCIKNCLECGWLSLYPLNIKYLVGIEMIGIDLPAFNIKTLIYLNCCLKKKPNLFIKNEK